MNNQLTSKIVNSIKDIPQDDWERLFSGQIESFGFYKTAEETDIGPFQLYYLLVYREERIIAIAPVFLFNFSLDLFAGKKVQKLINIVRKVFKNFLIFKTLLCGSPVTDIGFIGIDCTIDNKKDVLNFICEQFEKQALQLKVSSIGFKDFGEEFELGFLEKKGFVKVMSFPCVMQILPGNNLEDFFINLTSHKRYSLKRKIKKIKNLPRLSLEVKDLLSEYELDRIFELYLNTHNKSDISFDKLTKEFFVKIQGNMKDEAKFFLYKIEDKIVGFNLCFINDEVFLDKFLGFDYDCLYQYQLFFNRWFLNVDWCYKNGLRVYQSGQTGYDGKLQLGGKFKLLYIYGKHMNKFINLFARPFFMLAQPKNFDPAFKLIQKYKFEE